MRGREEPLIAFGMKLTEEWTPLETGTYQDHVIAHIVGASVIGYLLLNDAAHFLLDIGFVWKVYADGDMRLALQKLAVADMEDELKAALLEEINLLHGEGRSAEQKLKYFSQPSVDCLITEVNLYERGEELCVRIDAEMASIVLMASRATGHINLSVLQAEDDFA